MSEMEKALSESAKAAVLAAYRRIERDGYPHLCPVRTGKRVTFVSEMAILGKLARLGLSDGKSAPQLTEAGIALGKQLALRTLKGET